MSVELDNVNSSKVFRLMFNQLSQDKRKVNEDQTKHLSDEEIKKIVNAEIPNIEEVVNDLNNITANSNILNKKVRLSLNKEINRVIISIVDKDTDRVIKEIPCREIQNLAAHLKRAIGILYDNNAWNR